MSDIKHPRPSSHDADSEAAYWFSRLSSGENGTVSRKAFEVWRDEHPAHAEAFQHLEHAVGASELLADDPELRAARRMALKRSFRTRRLPQILTGALTKPKAAAIAAGLVVAAVSGAALLPGVDNRDPEQVVLAGAELDPPLYQTAVGENSVVTLADGSVVTLNTDTEFRTRYTEARRDIVLLRGQAVFKVAKNPDRPFNVYAGGQVVTAIGTEFEVRVQEEDLSVTLLEGRIVVNQVDLSGDVREGASAPVDLDPGQRLTAANGEVAKIAAADIEKDMSWREGRLEFQNEKLSEALDEFNRYSVRKVVISDPSLGDLRVGGSFKTDALMSFVAALENIYPVKMNADESDGPVSLTWDREQG